MKTNQFFFYLMFILLTSCASVGVTVSKSYPAKAADCNLDIYYGENEVKKEFEVIGFIDSKTGTTAFHDKTVAGAIKIAKPKACEMGADAIIVVQTEKHDANYATWGSGVAMLKCIKYK